MYEWLKIAHIISLIAWMAGLLYLPRLLIYHSDAETGADKSETFKIMERRLLKIIMTPAMIATWIFGLGLAVILNSWIQIWFIIKIVLVLAMTAFHVALSGWVKKFANDSNIRPAKFYRIANEVPTLIMIFIVILVVLKPF